MALFSTLDSETALNVYESFPLITILAEIEVVNLLQVISNDGWKSCWSAVRIFAKSMHVTGMYQFLNFKFVNNVSGL